MDVKIVMSIRFQKATEETKVPIKSKICLGMKKGYDILFFFLIKLIQKFLDLLSFFFTLHLKRFHIATNMTMLLFSANSISVIKSYLSLENDFFLSNKLFFFGSPSSSSIHLISTFSCNNLSILLLLPLLLLASNNDILRRFSFNSNFFRQK